MKILVVRSVENIEPALRAVLAVTATAVVPGVESVSPQRDLPDWGAPHEPVIIIVD